MNKLDLRVAHAVVPSVAPLAKPADGRDAEAQERDKLYRTPRWRALRMQHLAAHPLCAACMKRGTLTPATIVDHVQGHAAHWRALFWVASLLQSLCVKCHAVKTQNEVREHQQAKTRGIRAEIAWRRAQRKPAGFPVMPTGGPVKSFAPASLGSAAGPSCDGAECKELPC